MIRCTSRHHPRGNHVSLLLFKSVFDEKRKRNEIEFHQIWFEVPVNEEEMIEFHSIRSKLSQESILGYRYFSSECVLNEKRKEKDRNQLAQIRSTTRSYPRANSVSLLLYKSILYEKRKLNNRISQNLIRST